MNNPSEIGGDDLDLQIRSLLKNVPLPDQAMKRWSDAIEKSLEVETITSESSLSHESPTPLRPKPISRWRRAAMIAVAACLMAGAITPWLFRGDEESVDRLSDRAIQVCTTVQNRSNDEFRAISPTNRRWLDKIQSQFRDLQAIDETVVAGRKRGEYWGVVRVQRSDGAMGWLVVRPSESSRDYGSTFQVVPKKTGGWSIAIAQTSRILVFFVVDGSHRDLERWLHQRQTT